ncbi:MAG: hypothetical protein J2P17_33395 [Mycobacterium sp.]|nr:hypothetical protein [Mycobacterium sp.]
MSKTPDAAAQQMRALVETCEILEMLRPAAGAGVREWFEYHRHCAQTYVIFADRQSDADVAFEARWRAGRETLLARDFRSRLPAAGK